MKRDLRSDALEIINSAIESSQVDKTLGPALKRFRARFGALETICIAIGKAAWKMAKVAYEVLDGAIKKGVVITKYGHSEGKIPCFEIYEAGHPLPDENSIKATERVIDMVKELGPEDHVIFLVSGGGSALFELPLPGLTLSDIIQISDKLLKSGADISEFNTVRKHLSAVKGGRFAQLCYPARVHTFVLSDVIGNRLDTVASGPAFPDSSTSDEAFKVLEKYGIEITEKIRSALSKETPKSLENVETEVVGSIELACETALKKAQELGYNSMLLTTSLTCEAKEAGRFLGAVAREVSASDRPLKKPAAVICGGETVVRVTGTGQGGRNQELALSASIEIKGMEGIVLASVGTDGTDGPTDAAGGIVDGETYEKILISTGKKPEEFLKNNDSYNALKAANALIITGPTGTNVNDVVLLLVGE
ncbi:MAG: glycerate 2-kinase [Thermotogota bacterium]|nr:glycerate 2-kinase [Thermotogota bacterium]MDK2863998.1 glycerate 2-kinase [Thermotogota bacterium]